MASRMTMATANARFIVILYQNTVNMKSRTAAQGIRFLARRRVKELLGKQNPYHCAGSQQVGTRLGEDISSQWQDTHANSRHPFIRLQPAFRRLLPANRTECVRLKYRVLHPFFLRLHVFSQALPIFGGAKRATYRMLPQIFPSAVL